MKKLLIVLLIILAVIITLGAAVYFTDTKLLNNVNAEDINYIEVFSGNSGRRIKITDPEEIEYIVSNLKGATVKKSGISLGNMGYMYDIKFIGDNYQEVYSLILNSSDTVRMDPFFYHSDDYLCFEYIQELENKYIESKSENVTVIDTDRPNADTGNGTPKELAIGDVAPDFTATLVNGGTFRLSDYDNKIVLVNFWATWCGPCVGEMPAFENLKKDNMDDVEIICVNCSEDKDTVDKFVRQEGYTFNIGYDTSGKIGAYYPTTGIPYTVVVNKGKINMIYVGAYDAGTQYQEYKKAIEECR